LDEGPPFTWRGFRDVEAANGILQILHEMMPLAPDYTAEFLSAPGHPGLVLHINVRKTRQIVLASNKIAYVRVGASNQPVDGVGLDRLRMNKGIVSFEDSVLPAQKSFLVESPILKNFVAEIIPKSEPEAWLRSQQLLYQDQPIVAGVLLYAESPQALLPKRSAIKIYRYRTGESQGTRDTLVFDPITIEGCVYALTYGAVKKTVEIIQGINVLGPGGLEKAKYPAETLHEIITNAVLHRDYSIPDDIDVRIFGNRIEVESPGRLPGHITIKNILDEQFARNPKLVRLINKFSNPPNKDVGEGLNTAFEAMRKLQLKPPQIQERENSVVVYIRHEPLASAEELIMDYLETHGSITNLVGRRLCSIGSENVMKKVFERMMERNMIERVPDKRGRASAYRRRA
jgi:ATP-dependent DNA helicase RecG